MTALHHFRGTDPDGFVLYQFYPKTLTGLASYRHGTPIPGLAFNLNLSNLVPICIEYEGQQGLKPAPKMA